MKSDYKRGFARNVAKLTPDNVGITRQDGVVYEFIGVDELIVKDEQ